MCLYHRPSQTLFSGDHLSSPADEDRPDELYIFHDFNWFSVPLQIQSVKKLLAYDWRIVLPGLFDGGISVSPGSFCPLLAGHGRMAVMRDAQHREGEVDRLVRRHG